MHLFSKMSGQVAKSSLVEYTAPPTVSYSVVVGIAMVAQATHGLGSENEEQSVATDCTASISDGIDISDGISIRNSISDSSSLADGLALDTYATVSVNTFLHAASSSIASLHVPTGRPNKSANVTASTIQQEIAHISPDDMAQGIANLSFRRLSRVLPGIAMCASNITILNLSNNVLGTLPDEIGYLRRLQILDVSSNQIESLPPTIAYCRELRAIYASYNRLSTLPSAVRHLHALEKVDLYDNRIKCVPVCLHNLPSLEILDLSLNPIKCLASRMFIQGGIAALNRPKMLKLVLDGCPLRRDLHGNCPDNSNLGSGKPAQSAFPSLVETIVCKMANTNAEYPHELPDHLRACLDSLVACDHCHMLYPADKGVKRWRFAYRNKVSLPVEYNMCRPHWNNETERIASLFGLRKLENAQPYYKHKCAALEAITRKLSQNNTKLLGRWQNKNHSSSMPEHKLRFGYVRRGLRRLLAFSGLKGSRQQEADISGTVFETSNTGIASTACSRDQSYSHQLSAQGTTAAPVSVPMWAYFEDDVPDLPAL